MRKIPVIACSFIAPRITFFIASILANQTAVAAACPAGSISQTTDCGVKAQSTPACGTVYPSSGSSTGETSYYRRFSLVPVGLQIPTFTSVLLGIEFMYSANDDVQMTGSVRLYSLAHSEVLLTENLTEIGSATFTTPTSAYLSSLTVPIAATLPNPESNDFVVELYQPDLGGHGEEVQFFFGANNTGTATTYIRAPACGFTEPTALANYSVPSPGWGLIVALSGSGLQADLVFASGFDN
jgi:hypothetical protein